MQRVVGLSNPRSRKPSLFSVMVAVVLAGCVNSEGAPPESTGDRAAAIVQNISPQSEYKLDQLSCSISELTILNQRIPMPTPGGLAAWVLMNEGPSPAVIYVSNGDQIYFPVSGESDRTMFLGDPRYTYSVGLRRGGSAIVHVCS